MKTHSLTLTEDELQELHGFLVVLKHKSKGSDILQTIQQKIETLEEGE